MKNIFGSFFKELTGVNASECLSIEEIDSEITKNIHIKSYKSSVVHSRGNIFQYTQKHKNIDSKIDSYLS